jgi:hypothetical protein
VIICESSLSGKKGLTPGTEKRRPVQGVGAGQVSLRRAALRHTTGQPMAPPTRLRFKIIGYTPGTSRYWSQ